MNFDLNRRQQRIVEQLERSGKVLVSELSQDLNVSDVTVRKDLQELEQLSLLRRVHGGAVAAHRSKYNLSLGDKIGRLSAAKLAIAREALELVHDGDTLILDAGSTTLALARLLPGRVQGLTVITNSLPIIAELSQSQTFELISLGGMVRLHSLAMIGPLTVSSLKALHADIAFMGVTGATLERGLCTPNIIEAETKAAMIASSSRRVALADHSKLGGASLAPFADWSQIEQLITDQQPEGAFHRGLAELDVVLSVAEARIDER